MTAGPSITVSQSAEKQGNQLHMNVYKMKGQACGGPLKTEVKELKGDLRPAPPYPSRVKTVDKGTQVTPEREAVSSPTHPRALSASPSNTFYSGLTCFAAGGGQGRQGQQTRRRAASHVVPLLHGEGGVGLCKVESFSLDLESNTGFSSSKTRW